VPRIVIKPQWGLGEDDDRQRQVLPPLLRLLSALYDARNLTKACRSVGLSYRHAWGLVQSGSQIFGVPLVHFTRGQGARLTVLGEKLVWADRRVNARLSTILETLSAEIGADIERARADARPLLRIHASHGYAVAALRDFLTARGIAVELQFRGGVDGLMSLRQSTCELAGFHVPLGELESAALAHYAQFLRPRAHELINVTTRRQGLIVAKGNPRGVRSLADVLRPDVKFANRQRGSGTRMLLELMLARENLNPADIHGYDIVEFTHDAVAAYIASGMADTGLGVEAAAHKFNLDFIPLLSERYFLACARELLASELMREVIRILRSPEYRAFVGNHHGHDSAASGSIVSIEEAFAELPPLLER
jgi:molybdate transport repressor ModE-like protein